MVRTATITFFPFRTESMAATRLDFPLPVGASTIPIPPSRAIRAPVSSISRWWGR